MKYILIDIDGVLTDGKITIDINGNETKVICYRDLDAIGIGRRAGIDFIFVTGEDTKMVDVLAKRFNIQNVYKGKKDKLKAVNEVSADIDEPLDRLVYIGDSDRDAPALAAVGLGIAPFDGTKKARDAAHIITELSAGQGVLLEVINKFISGQLTFPREEVHK